MLDPPCWKDTLGRGWRSGSELLGHFLGDQLGVLGHEFFPVVPGGVPYRERPEEDAEGEEDHREERREIQERVQDEGAPLSPEREVQRRDENDREIGHTVLPYGHARDQRLGSEQ